MTIDWRKVMTSLASTVLNRRRHLVGLVSPWCAAPLGPSVEHAGDAIMGGAEPWEP